MKCPECKKKIDFGKQMKEWDEFDGDNVEGCARVNVWCENCEDMVLGVDIFPTPEKKEIKVPALKKETGADTVVMKYRKGEL